MTVLRQAEWIKRHIHQPLAYSRIAVESGYIPLHIDSLFVRHVDINLAA